MGKTKKKGRPSLLDLQKRSLKLQTQSLHNNHNQNHLFNNIKNNSNNNNDNNISINSNINKLVENDKVISGQERETFGSSDFTPGVNDTSILRKRKIDSISTGSGLDVEKQSIAVINKSDDKQVDKEQDDGPSTSLPDKKLLLFIVDSLQKKDTYGVFADPVDPEELPDYFEIIKSPMDYSTVRKKLEEGSYGSLEQFEKDIFLICSNAMQYNAPDSIYFRQARSMQELAKKNFDNLRQDSDDNELDPEPKIVRRGRPPMKQLKRPRGRPPLERPASKLSEANLDKAVGSTNRLNEHRKVPSHVEKYGSTLIGSSKNEAYVGRTTDRFERHDDMIGSASKGYSMKHGKKQIVFDESRRDTYQNFNASACRHEPSVLNTFKGERKQLIAVGLHTEYGYARSLARFAATLGPVAWKVASKKIERCLPSGVKYGQGWVGENGALSNRLRQQLPDASDHSSVAAPTPSQGLAESSGEKSEQKPQVKQLSVMHPKSNKVKILQTAITQSRVNGVNGTYVPNSAGETGNFAESATHPPVVTASSPDENGCEEANNTGPQQEVGSAPPDLNVGFQSPGSSGPMQPDLALQL